MSEWISVNERQPAHANTCIVRFKMNPAMLGNYFYAPTGERYWATPDNAPLAVSHWMPLPEATA